MGPIGGGPDRPMAEINVTPMVDVMLVLLLIFMVTAPLMQQGVAIALPKTKAQALPEDMKHLVLKVTANRKLYLGEQEIPFNSLRSLLKENIRLQQQRQVFLHADRNLPYGFVVDVMAILKEVGAEQLGLVTDPLGAEQRR